MSNIGIQRKRSRSIENEFEEFFPLAKRINNLELTFSQIQIINHNNNNIQQHIQKDFHQHQHQIPNEQQQQNCNSYNPELNIDQNPHYYYKNNILYDLYLERMRRNDTKSDP